MSSKAKPYVKRARSPYIAFGILRRPDVVAANPNAKPTEVIKLIAAEWQQFKADPDMFEGLQAQIDAIVEPDKIRFDRERARADAAHQATKSKHKMTGWLLFSAETRPIVREDPENEGMKFGDISREVGRHWRELGASGQAEYNTRAAAM
jgi:hypothetical protein